MISTSAFQKEMDASDSKDTLVAKLVSAWEKKNAKLARAGGVSLMALSLAACGSSDDTATDTTAPTTPVTTVKDTDGDGMIDSMDAFPNDASETTDTDGDGIGDNADAYPNDATNTAPAPAAVNKAFTNTLDQLEGGAGDDTFSGVYYADGGTGTTAFPGDSVTGGAGSDTLSISVAGLSTVAQAINAITTTGVEKLLVTNFDTNADDNEDTTVDTSLMSGLATVGINASSATGDTIFSNMTGILGAEMANGSADMTMTYIASVVAGAADSQALTVSNVSAGTFTANGAETIAINATTVKSTLTNVASDTLTKLTVAGDQALTISTALTAKTIDASANSGGVTVTLGTANQTITGGSGNDSIDADTVLTNLDTISGGAGSDTLTLEVGNATVNQGTAAAKGELYNVSGFETIDLASTHDNATLNLKDTSGVTTVELAAGVKVITVAGGGAGDGADATVAGSINNTTYTTTTLGFAGNQAADRAEVADAVAVAINALAGFSAVSDGTSAVTVTATTGASQVVESTPTASSSMTYTVADYKDLTVSNISGQTVNFSSGDDISLSLADASGSTDSLTVNLTTLAADSTFAKTYGDITANNIETINMDASGMGNGKVITVDAIKGNLLSTLNLTGDSDVTVSSFATSAKLATIDASASTGDITLAAAPSAVDQTISTGGGNDTITMGGLLTAADVIDAGGNNIPLNGTVVGSDTVTATGNIGTVTAASGLQIANAEAIDIATGGAAATYIDMAKVTGTSTMSFSSTSGTVKLTNLGAHHTVGAAIADGEFVGTLNLALADATGDADSVTIDYGTGADTASTVALTVGAAVETVNIKATTESGGGDTFTVTNTNNAAKNIVITKGDVADTMALGTLNAATTNVDAGAAAGTLTMTSAATGAVTVSASGAATTLHNIVTGAGNDTVTLTGLTGTAVNVLNGNGGTGDTLNLAITSASSDFTNVSGFETMNITVGANTQAGFDNATKDNGLNLATLVNILGGDSLSSFTLTTGSLEDDAAGTTMTVDASTFGGKVDLLVASDAFDAELTIKGGALTTDTVRATIAGVDNKIASMTGIENLILTSTNSDNAATADVTNATGIVTIDAQFANANNADQISIAGIAAGTKIKTTSTATGDNLVVALASATGTSDTVTLEVTATTVDNDTLNIDAAGIETLAITNKDATTLDVAGLTATGATGVSTVTIAGAGASIMNGINATTDTIDASTSTGALTVAAAQRTGDAKTIKGGTGNDSIAMENTADVLSGGLGTDTLVVDYTAVMGGIAVDLSSTTDQITTMESSANASAQIGFENVDLRAYDNFGSTVTGSALANTITGTAGNDNISAGKGDDTIQVAVATNADTDIMDGGAGADTLSILAAGTATYATDANLANIETITLAAGTNALVLTNQTEAFTITGGTGADTITGSSGKDTVTGGNGNDTLVATLGGDQFTMGTGTEEVEFGSVSSDFHVLIKSFTAGTDNLDINTTLVSDDGSAITAGNVVAGVYLAHTAAAADNIFQNAGPSDGKDVVFEFSHSSTITTGNFTTMTSAELKTSIVTALGSTTDNTTNNVGDIIVVLYDSQTSANSVIANIDFDATAGTLATTEISILAVVEGVGATNHVVGDFV